LLRDAVAVRQTDLDPCTPSYSVFGAQGGSNGIQPIPLLRSNVASLFERGPNLWSKKVDQRRDIADGFDI
jgi:hypothetical protein